MVLKTKHMGRQTCVRLVIGALTGIFVGLGSSTWALDLHPPGIRLQRLSVHRGRLQLPQEYLLSIFDLPAMRKILAFKF